MVTAQAVRVATSSTSRAVTISGRGRAPMMARADFMVLPEPLAVSARPIS